MIAQSIGSVVCFIAGIACSLFGFDLIRDVLRHEYLRPWGKVVFFITGLGFLAMAALFLWSAT